MSDDLNFEEITTLGESRRSFLVSSFDSIHREQLLGTIKWSELSDEFAFYPSVNYPSNRTAKLSASILRKIIDKIDALTQ